LDLPDPLDLLDLSDPLDLLDLPDLPDLPIPVKVYYSSTKRAGLVTAITRTSSAEKPPSSSFCANIAKPSATGGLIVWPRSVEISARAVPVFRMFANVTSQVALRV